ncbi:MAG: hypothetical protein BroJett025_10350 [Patescibacteria group bacterium]|nr:MAG: hypothetical protein BroJett025_10350 [Patescibacteria group bacterium]
MSYVITCGDEGVQVNEGTRLGFAGSGFRIEGFSEIITALKSLLGPDIRIAASEECDWMKQQLELSNWEQVTASTQQHIEALADREKLLYSGFVPFTDPKQLAHEIKAHMVRPRGVHIANKICFTLAGGEQTFNLGCFVISAEWLHLVDYKLAQSVIKSQVEFYKSLVSGTDLKIVFESEGVLGSDVAAKNAAILKKMGFESSEK